MSDNSNDFPVGTYARREFDSRIIKILQVGPDTVIGEDVWMKREHYRPSTLIPLPDPAQYLRDTQMITTVRQLFRVGLWPDLQDALITIAKRSDLDAAMLGINDILPSR